MSSHSRLQIARPRPVPPYLRVVEASIWLKLLNSRSIRSRGMPIPESRTEKCSRNRPSDSMTGFPTPMKTSPAAVNFTALPTRFTSTWRKRVMSPTIAAGTSGSIQ